MPDQSIGIDFRKFGLRRFTIHYSPPAVLVATSAPFIAASMETSRLAFPVEGRLCYSKNQGDDLQKDRFRAVLARHFGVEHFSDDAKLADLGLDSFGAIRLIVDLEEALGVSFAEEQLTGETFHSVGSLWNGIQMAGQAG